MAAERKYVWETWLHAGTVELREGRDFFCSPISFAQQLRNIASKKTNLRVSIESRGKSLIVTFTEKNGAACVA